MSDGYNYKRWEWLKRHFVRLSYSCLSYGCFQSREGGEHWIWKTMMIFLKQRGHSVTSTSEEYINTEPDLSIYDWLSAFQTSVRLLHSVVKPPLTMKSLRTVTSAFTICVMHHCCLFCQTLNCYKTGINVSRHLWSDYSLMHVTLPSGMWVLHYVYVK